MGVDFSESMILLLISFVNTSYISIFWLNYLAYCNYALSGYAFSIMSLLTPVPFCLGRSCLILLDLYLLFSITMFFLSIISSPVFPFLSFQGVFIPDR